MPVNSKASSKRLLYGGYTQTLVTAVGGTNYMPPVGIWESAVAPTVEAQSEKITAAGTLQNLRVKQTAGAGGGDMTFTVMLNGVASALTCTYTAGNPAGANDLTHTVAVVAGDVLSMRVVSSTGSASQDVGWVIELS